MTKLIYVAAGLFAFFPAMASGHVGATVSSPDGKTVLTGYRPIASPTTA